MRDKNLTEAAWKSFTKSVGSTIKDDAFRKALVAVEKSERADASKQLDALDELDKQAVLLRKAASKEARLCDQLDIVGKAIDKQRKISEELAKQEKQQSVDEDEEESPVLLTTRMVPLLRALRKGDTTLQVLIATTGKETAVLLSRKSISPARGKILKEYLNVSGALRFIRGECVFENNAYTFIVQATAGGLAKKLKTALLAQTELRLKVRVRGEDPADIDDDGEEAEAEDGANDSPKTDTRPSGAVPPAPASPEQRRFESRLAELELALAAALRDGRGDVSKMRAVAAFAREKGDAKLWADGLKSLDSLQKLIDPAEPATEAAPDGEAAAFTARLAAMVPRLKAAVAAAHPEAADIKLKLSEAGVAARKKNFEMGNQLLDDAEKMLEAGGTEAPAQGLDVQASALEAGLAAWRSARASAVATLRSMMKEVEDAAIPSSEVALIQANAVIRQLTAEPRTAQAVNELLRYVEQDDVVADICDLEVDIRSPMLEALNAMKRSFVANAAT